MTKIKTTKVRKMKNIKRYHLNQSIFYKLTTKSRLAKILGIQPANLRRLVKDIKYNEFYQTSPQGKKRLIESPTRELKIVQRKIARQLSKIEQNSFLQCPVKGRSYVTNAAHHIGADAIRTLDIKKYFPSTNGKKVYNFWHKIMKCNADVAYILTTLSTYKGHLPTGSPLSPILAFFANQELWVRVNNLAHQHNCKSTLYVDDLTISGQSVSGELFWEIKKEIKHAGLDYHKEKYFRNGKGEITGVILKGDRIYLPQRQLLKIHNDRRALRTIRSNTEYIKTQKRLSGLLEQAKQVILK